MGCSGSKSSNDKVDSPTEAPDDGSFKSQYILGEQLGTGAFSVVCKGTRKADKKVVAVKCIKRKDLNEEDYEALKQEVEILEAMNHPHIIEMYGYFEEPTKCFLVMEVMAGGELFDRIVQKAFYNEKEARDLVRILLESIRYLHDADIVHRDLKPENLLLNSVSDDAHIKIADFGFAKRLKGGKLTTQCGTPGYVAPEILEGVPYETGVDIWSIGVITYILIGGYPPFHDENQAELYKKIRRGQFKFHEEYWGNVSDEAKDLIQRMLTVNVNDRITANDSLKHAWVMGDDEVLRARNLDGTITELRKFNAKRKLRAAAKAVIATHRVKRLLEGLKDAAQALDEEKDDEKTDDQL